MQDLSNEVQTGYFTDSSGFECTMPPGNSLPPTITTGGSSGQSKKGTNYGCTFIGYVIQFEPTNQSNDTTKYDVFAVFARQFTSVPTSTPIPPTSFQDAHPVAELVKTVTIPPRLAISKVSFKDPSVNSGSEVTDGAFGFFSNFTIGSGSGLGTQNTMLVPIPTNSGTGYDIDTAYPSPPGAASGIPFNIFHLQNSTSSITESTGSGWTPSIINPLDGVQICLQDQDNTNQYAIYTVGGNGTTNSFNGNPLSVQFSTGTTCP